MAEERPIRRHRRFNISLPLWVRYRKGKADSMSETSQSLPDEEQTTTTSISVGGCSFFASKRPAIGTPATMLVDIPLRASGRSGKVLCKGKVVWVGDREVQGKVGVACTIDSYQFKPPTRS